jgi:hypothetical protein
VRKIGLKVFSTFWRVSTHRGGIFWRNQQKESLDQQRRSSFSQYVTRGLYSTSAVGDFLERVYAKVYLFVKKVYGAGTTIIDDMLLMKQVIMMIQ